MISATVGMKVRRLVMAPWAGREGVVEQVGDGFSEHNVLVRLGHAARVTPAAILANAVEAHSKWLAVDELEEIS